jgi:uncharacterized protein
MKFEWDPHKAEINRRKHGVSFDEAGSVFLDRLALSGPDPKHSIGELRYITFGALARCFAYIPARCDSNHHCPPCNAGRKETL